MSQQDKLDLLLTVLVVYNDEEVQSNLAMAFAESVEDNFDIDLSAFTSLIPVCGCDCDDDEDDVVVNGHDEDDDYDNSLFHRLAAAAIAKSAIEQAIASSKGGL